MVISRACGDCARAPLVWICDQHFERQKDVHVTRVCHTGVCVCVCARARVRACVRFSGVSARTRVGLIGVRMNAHLVLWQRNRCGQGRARCRRRPQVRDQDAVCASGRAHDDGVGHKAVECHDVAGGCGLSVYVGSSRRTPPDCACGRCSCWRGCSSVGAAQHC